MKTIIYTILAILFVWILLQGKDNNQKYSDQACLKTTGKIDCGIGGSR